MIIRKMISGYFLIMILVIIHNTHPSQGVEIGYKLSQKKEYIQIQWNYTYGGTKADYAISVVETTDGGYLLVGHTKSFGAGEWDMWLVKTDSSGVTRWNQTYGGTNEEWAYSVLETADDGYLLTGWTSSFGAGKWDIWLIKTDITGVTEWNQTYGGLNDDGAMKVIEATDGGYLLVGYTQSFGVGEWDIWLIKTDRTGVAQWNQTYGGTKSDDANAVLKTTDGGYLLAGSTWSFGEGGSDMWLVKTDNTGVAQWNLQ
ncbi:MAG: hypothetical protein ACXAC7_15400 [Candidatus Hodarchaeales archaeon]|jgi:hypothetical protein